MLTILTGDAIEQLRTLPDESVQCCVTSPPYWGLRDYSTDGQLGLEKTPEEYVEKLVEVFREVRRVLRKDGTLWLNLGDSYAGSGPSGASYQSNTTIGRNGKSRDGNFAISKTLGERGLTYVEKKPIPPPGLKAKDLCGIPWRVAFALQADGWWLRSDIIWAKPNPMPESVTDRPTKSHEYLFLLTKSANYFYDAEAIKERAVEGLDLGILRSIKAANGQGPTDRASIDKRLATGIDIREGNPSGNRNKRSVWTIATAPYPDAHFATYPPDLIKPCIMAGTSAKGCCAKCGAPWERIVEREKSFESGSGRAGNMPNGKQDLRASDTNSTPDIRLGPVISTQTLGWQPTCKHQIGAGWMVEPCTVLDPFAGSGTTGMVALELGRKAVLIELNPAYVELIEQRCNVTPGLQLA